MIKYLTILWIAAFAAVAQAEDDRGTAFSCGLKMGSGQGAAHYRELQSGHENTGRRAVRHDLRTPATDFRPLPLRVEPIENLFPQRAAKTGARRLLPVFTVARFVCSWL